MDICDTVSVWGLNIYFVRRVTAYPLSIIHKLFDFPSMFVNHQAIDFLCWIVFHFVTPKIFIAKYMYAIQILLIVKGLHWGLAV